jgi:hypothetical protein
MRLVWPPAWLRRHLVLDAQSATCSFAGGVIGPFVVAGLQAAVAASSDWFVFFTVLLRG